MVLTNIILNGHVCNEAEVATIREALWLLAGVGQGLIHEVGTHLHTEFLARRDITSEFRARVAAARSLIDEAHKKLHGTADFKARFDPAQDPVPVSAVRAHLLMMILDEDKEGEAIMQKCLRVQAEMCRPR